MLEFSLRPYLQLNPNLVLFTEYTHIHYYGDLKALYQTEGMASSDNKIGIGLSVLF